MKKILIILILGLISCGDILAQDLKKFNYQLDLGTTLTIPFKNTIEIWPDTDNPPQTNYRSNLGYFFEFLVSYNLNKKYAISTGLNYNYNSLKIDNTIGLIEDKGNLTTSYFTLPVLCRYRFSDKIPLSISVGPYLGFLVIAKENGISYIDTARFVPVKPDPVLDSIEPRQKYNNDISKDYTSIDIGLSVQCDYEIKLSKRLTGIILTRFNYGFKDVITNDMVNNNLANDWRNYNFMIGFGIKL